MKDYECLFVTTLHGKLKEKINAAIYVAVKDDTLVIDIKKDGIIYTGRIVDNFSERIMHGYSTDYAMYEVIKDYRAFINKIFFY